MKTVSLAIILLVVSAVGSNAHPTNDWMGGGQTVSKTRHYVKHYKKRYHKKVVVQRGHGNVRSKSGATARVNPKYREKFQCLIDKLDDHGYKINIIGGYRKTKIAGTNIWSKHASGNAIDINQYSRGYTKPRIPKASDQWAIDCGLYPGSFFGDRGHFEIPGKAGWHSEFVPIGPFKVTKPEPIKDEDREAIFARDEENNYLCSVYNRQPIKKDSTGDFTWKDQKAASLKGMGVCEYVIGGMNPRLKTALTKLGKKLDEKGIRWSILSGFRDNYRQKIAEGFKASICRSYHGGSCSTKGYGDGKAVDVTLEGDDEDNPKKAGDIFAKYAAQYGLSRPMPYKDPAHVQLADLGKSKHWARRHSKKKRHYASR